MDDEVQWRQAAKSFEMDLIGSASGEPNADPESFLGDAALGKNHCPASGGGQESISDTEMAGGRCREGSPAVAQTSCDRDRAGTASGRVIAAVSASTEANDNGVSVLVRRLTKWRVVEVSQIERWVFSGSRVDASGRRY